MSELPLSDAMLDQIKITLEEIIDHSKDHEDLDADDLYSRMNLICSLATEACKTLREFGGGEFSDS